MRLRVEARKDTERKPEKQTNRPKLVSVKRNERSERSEDPLFERSEFRIFSERRKWSSEAGSALTFWLLFCQEKSNKTKTREPACEKIRITIKNRFKF